MVNLKAALVATAAMLAGTNAFAVPVFQFATSASDALSWNGSIFNAGVLTPTPTTSSSSAFVSTIGTTSGTVPTAFLTIGGGAGVTTTGLLTSGCFGGVSRCFQTTADTTISYKFATPTNYLGVGGVQNIFSYVVTAGSQISFTTNRVGTVTGITIAWTFSDTDLLSPTSDVYKFGDYGANSPNELSVTYSFPQFSINSGGIANGFQAVGSGTFASNPLPAVPEAPSAALLVAGLATVAFVSRRRAA